MRASEAPDPPRVGVSVPRLERGVVVRAVVIAGLIAFALLGLPALLGTYWLTVCTAVTVYSIVALGAGLLLGRVGLVSLCQIALMAVGAWVAARLLHGTSLPFPLVLLIAGGVTAALGVLVGLPALRLHGLYLALITLMGAGAISVALSVIHFPNGGGGFKGVTSDALAIGTIRRPEIATSDISFYRYSVVVLVILLLLALIHVSTKPGRAWAAIRESEPAAVAAGVHITLYKLWAFALAAFLAGVAGGLMGASAGQLSIGPFATQESVILIAATLMGGVFSLWGALVAGALLQLVPALLQDWGLPSEILIILFGVGVLQVLLTAPAGLVAQVPKDLAKLARLVAKPFRPQHAGA